MHSESNLQAWSKFRLNRKIQIKSKTRGARWSVTQRRESRGGARSTVAHSPAASRHSAWAADWPRRERRSSGFDSWWWPSRRWTAASWPRRRRSARWARRRASGLGARARRGQAWERRGDLRNASRWPVWLMDRRRELAPCGRSRAGRRRSGGGSRRRRAGAWLWCATTLGRRGDWCATF
jgi:hypothetical protein